MTDMQVFEMMVYTTVILAAVALGAKRSVGMAFLIIAFLVVIGNLIGIPYYDKSVVILLIIAASALISFGTFMSESNGGVA